MNNLFEYDKNGNIRAIDREESQKLKDSPVHYHVRLLKFMPDKICINNKVVDRANLSHNQRIAVKAEEAKAKKRAELQVKADVARLEQQRMMLKPTE